MNVTINQSTANQEIVNSNIITKLYNTFILQEHTSNLSGNLYSPSGYKSYVDALMAKYDPNLIITIPAEGQFILFQDSAVEQFLLNKGIGGNGGITVSDAATANFTQDFFKDNTTITSFPEFKYFTRANTLTSNAGSQMFRGCTNLTDIDLSEIRVFHRSQFNGSGITTVNAPNVEEYASWDYGASTFYGCINLTTVQNLGILTSTSADMFARCTNLVSVILPSTMNTLNRETFCQDSNLETITGLSNIKYLNGNEQFLGCSKLQINTETDLANIISIDGRSNFNGCSKIKGNLYMPKLTSISGGSTFYGTKLNKILCLGTLSSIPGDFTRLWNYSEGTITEIYLPYECTAIGSNAFRCQGILTTVKQYNKTLSAYQEGESPVYQNMSRVTTFNEGCFCDCRLLVLTNSDISQAVSIGNSALSRTKLTGAISLPNISNLGSYAFEGTLITSLDISQSSLISLSEGLFYNCSSLTSISLPNTITSIGRRCFYGCNGLSVIDLSQISTSSLNDAMGYGNLFSNCSSLTTLGISNFPGITKIGLNTFSGCSSLAGQLSFPDCEELPANTNDGGIFIGCNGLTKITIGKLIDLLSVPYSQSNRGAFSGCANLKIVDLGDSLQRLGTGHFNSTPVQAVIIRITTPPIITSSGYTWEQVFGNNGAILYVPSSALSNYQSDTWFGNYTSRIKTIENDYNEQQILGV